MVVDSFLLRPYFLGPGGIGGVPVDFHEDGTDVKMQFNKFSI